MVLLGIITIFIITISVFVIFFQRFSYVKQSNLSLWGGYLLLDATSIGLVVITHKIVFPDLPIETSTSLYVNMFLVIQMGITMLMFRKFYQIEDSYLIIIFVLFLVIWITEIVTLGKITTTLRLTTVFSRTIIVIGVWLYFFQVYRNTYARITDIPFFWISMGWLVYFGITGAAFIPQIAQNASVVEKEILSNFHTAAEGISRLLYAIGFWKTKKWIENYN